MRPAETRDNLLRCSKRHRSLALQYMLRNFVPGEGRGAWQRLAACPRTCDCLSNDHGMCRLCCAEQVKLEKEAHLTCSTLIQF